MYQELTNEDGEIVMMDIHPCGPWTGSRTYSLTANLLFSWKELEG